MFGLENLDPTTATMITAALTFIGTIITGVTGYLASRADHHITDSHEEAEITLLKRRIQELERRRGLSVQGIARKRSQRAARVASGRSDATHWDRRYDRLARLGDGIRRRVSPRTRREDPGAGDEAGTPSGPDASYLD